ncbi:MAG: cadmium-translocating P-type ATPase [Parcubacteria group bacterium]|nr:cadmium-translocating P-type ATPase [Parcubacteria group bacterium]
MHPEIRQEKPGMCPECGMSLVPTDPGDSHHEHDHAGHNKHAGHRTNSFIRKFWITLVLTIPILIYSDLPRIFFSWKAPEFAFTPYISFVLGSIIFFYCGFIFLSSAYREIKARLPGMMTLIALAITTAYTYSVYETIIGGTNTLWWELSSLIAVMLLGHWIEMRAVQGAQGALKELAKLLPDVAERIKGDSQETETVSVSELKEGDIVLVRPGGKVPADGKIVDGKSELDESIITGESKPVEKTVDDEVIAGSTNGDGSLKIKITKVGEKTFLSGIMRLVADAQASKSRMQVLSDRAALWLTFIAVGSGGITVVTWLSLGAGVSTSIERLVAVLVIACPHALGLAIPLVSSISTTMGAKNGLLVRQKLALESAKDIDVVLFDKTGTLTEAKFKVISSSSDEALSFAASVNTNSEHPIAKAIVEEAKNKSLSINEVSGFKRVAGKGAEGNVLGKHIFVGTKGGDDIVVERDGQIIGKIVVADAVRPESKEAIDRLKKSGIRVAMITGDSEKTAKQVAEELGLDQYFARVLPEDKVKKVIELQSQNLKVAMVGDGINDAPALTQADLGIAIGAGTNVAIESAGIVLVKSDPRDIAKIIHLSKLTYSKMVQNLWWAAGYNIVAIPLAAGVLAVYGIFLQPAVAAIFMSASTVIVSFNAVLMRRKKI